MSVAKPFARFLLLLMALVGLLVGASCDDGCPTTCEPNQRQCSSGGILTCVIDPGGLCYSWGIIPCTGGKACTLVNGQPQCGTGGVNPPPNCDNPQFKKQCVGQSIYWFDNCGKQGQLWTTCPQGVSCQNGLCTNGGCQNPCTPGAAQCSPDNSGTQLCPSNGGTCPQWGPTTPCQAGQTCNNGRCGTTGGCTTECPADTLRCQGNSVQVCQLTTGTCTTWSQPQPCPPNQTCTDGFCGGGGTCTDECAGGQQRCQGAAKQVCKSNGKCLVWSPNPCGVNAQCMAADGRVGCSCLTGYNPAPNGRDCVKGN